MAVVVGMDMVVGEEAMALVAEAVAVEEVGVIPH